MMDINLSTVKFSIVRERIKGGNVYKLRYNKLEKERKMHGNLQ